MRFLKVFWILIPLFCVNAINAQNGSIQGHIVDNQTGEDLVGVVVQIPSLGLGAATDLFGLYTIKNVPPGTYEVAFKLVSYTEKKVTDVVVAAGQSLVLDATMSNAPVEVGVVNVIGVRNTQAEAAVIEEIKGIKGVVSGLGGAQIAKTQDASGAQVARRIPGVTVVDNRFVMVRGLSERYNAVLLNGVQIPSLEADVKSFSFDLIPSSAIDRFLIFKSPSPELQGEFAGGAIQVYTKNIPDYKLLVDLTMTSGWRSGTTGKTFFTNTNASTEKFGFDSKVRALPSDFPENVRAISDASELQRIGRTLENNWALNEGVANADGRMNLTVANRFAVKNVKLGQLTTFNYGRTNAMLDAHRLDYNVYDETTQRSDTVFDYNDAIYQRNVTMGLIHNWGVSYKKHQFDWKNFFNQAGLQSNTIRTGRAIEEGNFRKEYSFNYNQRQILATQLSGRHEWTKNKLDWTLAYGQTRRSDPDWKRIRYTKPLDGSDEVYHAYVPFGAQPFYLGRLYLRMNESIRTVTMNYTRSLFKTGEKDKEPVYALFKTGAYIEDKNRVFAARNIGYAQANVFQFDYSLDALPLDQILADENINTTTGFKIDEDTKGSDSYRAENNLFAWYAMVELPWKKWNVTAGLRLEQSSQELESATLTGDPIQVNLDTLVALPSVNVSYAFSEKLLLRGAYGKTINRPEFRELAPYSFYDFEQNFIINGNPSVTVATIQNFDLRLERYPRPGEILSLSLFYKDFTNPIEMYFAPGVGSGGTRSFTPGNALSAQSYGVEIDVRKSLRELTTSRFLDNLSIVANASIIESNVEVSEAGLETGLTTDRPLMGQSPYIINGGIYYQNDSTDWQFSLLYNVIGPRIAIVGIPGNPEVYEMERHLIDLSVTKTFKKKYSIRFGVQDMLNQDTILLQDANMDGELSKENDQRLRYFNRGTYFTLSFMYKFREK